MTKVLVVVAIALVAASFAWSQTNDSHAKESQLNGTWELVSGQPLPKGARDIEIISGGYFIFVAYDAETGKPLYTGGGTWEKPCRKFGGGLINPKNRFKAARIQAEIDLRPAWYSKKI